MSRHPFDPHEDLQVIIAFRHGQQIPQGSFPKSRIKTLHPVGRQLLLLMAHHIAGHFPFQFKGVMHSPATRSAESAKIFIGTTMTFHPNWKKPELSVCDDLLPWSQTQSDMMAQAFAAAKAHQKQHGGTVIDAAFSLSECQQALAMSAHDGYQAVLKLVPYDTSPGVYVLGGMHSPQIDTLGLHLCGAASISQREGFTKENAEKYLGGFSRQCEGWIMVYNLKTKKRKLYPLKYPRAVASFIAPAMMEAHKVQQNYASLLKRAGITQEESDKT